MTETICISQEAMLAYVAAMHTLEVQQLADVKEVSSEKHLGDTFVTLQFDRSRDLFHLGSFIEFYKIHHGSREIALKEATARKQRNQQAA